MIHKYRRIAFPSYLKILEFKIEIWYIVIESLIFSIYKFHAISKFNHNHN